MPRWRRGRDGAAKIETIVPTNGSGPTQMTAAAQVLHSRKIQRAGSSKQKKTASMAWQADVWAMFDEIGELWFSSSWTANCLSRVGLYAAMTNDADGDPDPVTEGPAAELVADFAGGAGGQAALLSRIGYHLSLVGDSYIVARNCYPDVVEGEGAALSGPADPSVRIGPPDQVDPDEPIDVEWQAYSTDEVSYDRTWRINDGFDDWEISDSDLIIRCWRPHPRKWAEAQSAVRSSLPVLRELRGLTMHVSAQVDSRLAGAGILFLPQSMVFASSDEDTAEGEDPFIRDLMDHMLTPIKDRDSAAAVVPFVVKVPDDAIGKIQHITFGSELDAQAKDLRDEALRRFALGQDLPASIILGSADTNHWSAWLEDEQAVRAHVAPLASAVCLALTVGWLQPALEELGVENARDYMVWFDLSRLIHRPDRTEAAVQLHDRFLVGDETVRREAGFNEEDKPSPEEFTRMVLLALLKSGGDVTPVLQALGIRVDLAPTAPATAPAVDPPAPVEDPRAIPELPDDPASPDSTEAP